MSAGEILWQPTADEIVGSRWNSFARDASAVSGISLSDPLALYQWSVAHPETFWKTLAQSLNIKFSTTPQTFLVPGPSMRTTRWCEGGMLNFAENLLQFRDNHDALVFWGEDKVRRKLSYAELYNATAKLQHALRSWNIQQGDRVAAMVPNLPEAVVGVLASSACGAVWSSCSPDFGIDGILDRFGQINPKVLIIADGYYYKGHYLDVLEKAKAVIAHIPSIEHVVVISYDAIASPCHTLPKAVSYHAIMAGPGDVVEFTPLPFHHPLYIVYSSGTTGKPKCIVHSAGGVLLEQAKELIVHSDLRREDRLFYQTTCGWMMWNWLICGLFAGSTLLLYDGFPFQREGKILFDFAEQERMTIFGTNAKYLSAIEKLGLCPRSSHALTALRSILSTGSTLLPESFDYVYKSIHPRIRLSSISGGTDILGCFALGCPVLPVRRGELQIRSLGLAVNVYDEHGSELRNAPGQLVCSAPFPSMPIKFWNDPTGEKYERSYFSRYPNVWHHGDYVELRNSGGMVFYGRSDTVLNPGGIRIGTSEIYRQVEKFKEVSESLVTSQKWEGDERIVLFVKLQPGKRLDDSLSSRIREAIRHAVSPHHVPKKILEVPDIPKTRNGKIVELAVKNVLHGYPLSNIEALANPEALDFFRNRKELVE